MQMVQRINLPGGGSLIAVWSERGLLMLGFADSVRITDGTVEGPPPVKSCGGVEWREALSKLLTEYFSGTAVDFTAIPVDFEDYTPFQRRVLSAVRRVPYGGLTTYGAVAAKIGQPRAARAVGQVMKRNRTILVIPCHRVLSRNGLGGFSCGLSFKKRLLRLEGHL